MAGILYLAANKLNDSPSKVWIGCSVPNSGTGAGATSSGDGGVSTSTKMPNRLSKRAWIDFFIPLPTFLGVVLESIYVNVALCHLRPPDWFPLVAIT